MMPWQKEEVRLTDSENEFNKIRGILSGNNIKYDYRIKSRNQTLRSDSPFLGRYGTNPSAGIMYYIYVNKKDYEYAAKLLQNAGK